jgi:hypothetical protein
MRRNERERLARRDAYKASKEKWVMKHAGGEVVATLAEGAEYDDERNIAYHEAGHAVAAWGLGQRIVRMCFNTAENMAAEPTTSHVHAYVSNGLPLPEVFALTEGERYVHAVNHAFVTLAGVFGGSNSDAASSNPLRKRETVVHLQQACSIYKVICLGENVEHEIEKSDRDRVARLLPLVDEFTSDPCIDGARVHLAKNLVRLRNMTGEEVVACIEQAYSTLKEAQQKQLAAAAGKGKV